MTGIPSPVEQDAGEEDDYDESTDDELQDLLSSTKNRSNVDNQGSINNQHNTINQNDTNNQANDSVDNEVDRFYLTV